MASIKHFNIAKDVVHPYFRMFVYLCYIIIQTHGNKYIATYYQIIRNM